MPLARAALLAVLVCLLKNTNQQSSWWLSDHELFYDDPTLGAVVYNTRTDNATKMSYSNDGSDTLHSYSRDLKYVAEITEIPELRSFKWSHGSAFAFELENKTIYYASAPGEEPIRVTENENNSVSANQEFKADADIVAGSIKAKEGDLSFSPSDKYLAYSATEKNNSTKKVPMTTYDRSEKYDYHYDMEYEQTGEEKTNFPSIVIWSVGENRTINTHPTSDQLWEYYHLDSSWVVLHGKEVLLVTWANRWYNRTTINLCSPEKASCWRLFNHLYYDRMWASHGDYSNIVYSNDSIFVLLPSRRDEDYLKSEDVWWQHILRIFVKPDLRFGGILQLFSGSYDVQKIIAYLPKENRVVYSAQAPHPWNMQVYSTPAYEKVNSTEQDQCLTCGFSQCTYQDRASISPGEELKLNFWCLGPVSPYQSLIFLDEKLQRTETRFLSLPATLDRPKWTLETFRLSSGYEANVRVYFGESTLPSVPVTLLVYGGPNFNQVKDRYSKRPDPLGYNHAIVQIDVRGSGGRGWKYRSPIYGGLVTVEVEDTLEAMQMVLDKYPRLDKRRVGVYGWSYGGTMAIALVEKAPPSFFQCAIAGAPVSNFLYYWASYAEKYMGDAPPSAYTDLTRNVAAFNQTKLLLIHGLRDDRVHFRHSAVLAEALQQADIPFEFMVYPNQDHYVMRNVSDHLDHLFDSFMTKCYE